MGDDRYRYEYKYLISYDRLKVLEHKLSGLLKRDAHVFADGKYEIRSLYFDDLDDSCFYENENGNDPRVKYRIRIYNRSDDIIMLEKKKKERGKTLKTSAEITKEQYRKIISGDYRDICGEQPELLKSFLAEMRIRMLRPSVIVDYERYPFVLPSGNVRITLDTNISSSHAVDRFFDENIPKRPILPGGHHLLEVKFDEYIPDWLYNGMMLPELRQITFSKYYLCRKYTLAGRAYEHFFTHI